MCPRTPVGASPEDCRRNAELDRVVDRLVQEDPVLRRVAVSLRAEAASPAGSCARETCQDCPELTARQREGRRGTLQRRGGAALPEAPKPSKAPNSASKTQTRRRQQAEIESCAAAWHEVARFANVIEVDLGIVGLTAAYALHEVTPPRYDFAFVFRAPGDTPTGFGAVEALRRLTADPADGPVHPLRLSVPAYNYPARHHRADDDEDPLKMLSAVCGCIRALRVLKARSLTPWWYSRTVAHIVEDALNATTHGDAVAATHPKEPPKERQPAAPSKPHACEILPGLWLRKQRAPLGLRLWFETAPDCMISPNRGVMINDKAYYPWVLRSPDFADRCESAVLFAERLNAVLTQRMLHGMPRPWVQAAPSRELPNPRPADWMEEPDCNGVESPTA